MLLPSCLLYGMSYEKFYVSTPREIMYWLDTHLEKELNDLKTKSSLAYWLVSNISLAFNKPSELPKSLKEAFPSVFDYEMDEETQQQLFLEGAMRINSRKERSDE